MSTQAKYYSLLSEPFESEFLPYPLTISPEAWEAFREDPESEPELAEEADIYLDSCCDQISEAKWEARTPGSIRRLLAAQPPRFERVVSDPAPLLAAWALLCGTLGAGPERKYALPWWVEAAYSPQDYFVGLTPPAGLSELIEAMRASNLVETVSSLLAEDQDDKYYLADLLSLCQFLDEAAGRKTWVLGVECGS